MLESLSFHPGQVWKITTGSPRSMWGRLGLFFLSEPFFLSYTLGRQKEVKGETSRDSFEGVFRQMPPDSFFEGGKTPRTYALR